MKLWIVISIFSIFAFSILNDAMEMPEHIKKLTKRLRKRCQNQSGTPNEVISSSIGGILPKEQNFPCYVFCLFDIMGLIDDNKVIHLENLLHILPEELHSTINMLTKTCGTKDGNDKCDIVFNTMQCYANNEPQMLHEELWPLFD